MTKRKMNNSGITLIALVLTIIVLLILAGVSIAMLSGDNSILNRATTARENSEKTQIEERIKLAYHAALTGGQGSYTKESIEEELEKEFGENNYNVDDSDSEDWILTAKGQSVTIPAGIKIKTATLQGKEFFWGGNFVQVNNGNANHITGIIRSRTKPANEIIEDTKHLWSTEQSENKVYFWLRDNIIYYWTEADTIFLGEDCSYMFSMKNLQDITGLRYFNASKVKNMMYMFNGAKSLSNIEPIKNWKVNNVTNMSYMFANCEGLTSVSDLKDWNVSMVENMEAMFANCYNLSDIDLTNWETLKLTNTSQMFSGCEKLKTIYTSTKFVMTLVNNSRIMFGSCNLLKGGSGTTFDATKVDKTYAHIDGGTSNPGYFTAK